MGASDDVKEFLGPLAVAVDNAGGQQFIVLARTAAVHALSLPAATRWAAGLEVLRSALQQRGVVLPEDVLCGALGAALVLQRTPG